jgi:sugar lactone lactonase YvrE
VDQRISLPSKNVMSCTFGGSGLDVLYVTSGRIGMTAEQLAAEPQAGALFAIRTGHRGFAEVAFKGTPPGP